MKTALVTGITGQAGYYLSKILLREGFKVIGLKRRNSTLNNEYRLQNLKGDLKLEYGDITDPISLIPLLVKYKPSHFYNLAAQSHVWISFKEPLHTFEVTAKGVLNCLEAIRISGIDTKFFQASSSEMFGTNVSIQDEKIVHLDYSRINDAEKKYLASCNAYFQYEDTPFNPQSPYAVAKVAAHNYCQLYKKAYGMWVSCGIMGNYESPFRGEEFVTKKITSYLAKLTRSYQPLLKLGNIESFRDWTFAGDTMEAVYLMMQQDKPDNYVIGTGETNSVKTFLETAIDYLNRLGYHINKDCYEIDPELFRPSEVPYLKMDSSKIRKLGWKPKENFKSLVEMMMLSELLV